MNDMATVSIADRDRADIIRKELMLIARAILYCSDRSIAHDDEKQERERIIEMVVLFEGKLQKRDFDGLFKSISRDRYANAGTEFVGLEYATRLFKSALEAEQHDIALKAYDLITRIAEVITPNDVPAEVIIEGGLLAREYLSAMIEDLQRVAVYAPLTGLRRFGLDEDGGLKVLNPSSSLRRWLIK